MTSIPSWKTLLGAAVFLSALDRTLQAQTVYVSNFNGNSISKITSNGTVSTFASTDKWPEGLAFDNAGNLYAAINWDHEIQKFDSNGTGSVFATFASAGVLSPTAMAFDGAGNLYFADITGNSVRKITPGGVGSVFATGLNLPYGLAFDQSGNLYASSLNGNTVTKITPGGATSLFISGGLNGPAGLAFSSSGDLYVANYTGSTIEKFSSSGSDLGTFLSTGLSQPIGIAFDTSDNLFVANLHGTDSVVKVTPGGVSSVFATGLDQPYYLAIQGGGISEVPETSTWAAVGFLAGIGGLNLWRRMKRPAPNR